VTIRRTDPDRALVSAIGAFRNHREARRCQTPQGAHHRCAKANTLFALHCWQRGLDGRLAWFTAPDDAFRPDDLLLTFWTSGWFVDWSIRQHDPEAAVPWLFTDPAPQVPGFTWRSQLTCDAADLDRLRAAGLNPLSVPIARLPVQARELVQIARYLRPRLLQRAERRGRG
jgi:hypothetical protein